MKSHLNLWRLPLVTTCLGIAFAIGLSFALPFQYGSTARVFVTQPSAAGLDAYTAIKSTERVASTLSELVYSTVFFDQVLSKSNEINRAYFPEKEIDRRKMWRKTISTGIEPGTGIVTVSAYHPDRAQARLLVDGVTREMALQAPNLFGYNIRVQVIDAPLDSRWFAKPDFVQNATYGAAIGLLLGVGVVFIQSARRREW